jgi:hypothetical protein
VSDAWIEITTTVLALAALAVTVLRTKLGDRIIERLDRPSSSPLRIGLLFALVTVVVRIGMGLIFSRPIVLPLFADAVILALGTGLIMYAGLRKRQQSARRAESR